MEDRRANDVPMYRQSVMGVTATAHCTVSDEASTRDAMKPPYD